MIQGGQRMVSAAERASVVWFAHDYNDDNNEEQTTLLRPYSAISEHHRRNTRRIQANHGLSEANHGLPPLRGWFSQNFFYTDMAENFVTYQTRRGESDEVNIRAVYICMFSFRSLPLRKEPDTAKTLLFFLNIRDRKQNIFKKFFSIFLFIFNETVSSLRNAPSGYLNVKWFKNSDELSEPVTV